MAVYEPTYALLQAPSFDVIPDTDVKLGSIHPRTRTKPRRPDTKRILNRSSRVDIPPDLLRTRLDPNVVLGDEKLRSSSAGVNVQLPLIDAIGGGISGEGAHETVVCIYATNVETQWFLPDDAYFEQALKGVTVRKELFGFRAPSVFLVTGVKIAERAIIISSLEKSLGGDLGPEVDLTTFGVPINLSASISGKRQDHRIVATEKKNFVLAFETRRIRVRKQGFSEKSFNNFAMLDDEQSAEAALHESLTFDETTTEVDDEHDDN